MRARPNKQAARCKFLRSCTTKGQHFAAVQPGLFIRLFRPLDSDFVQRLAADTDPAQHPHRNTAEERAMEDLEKGITENGTG